LTRALVIIPTYNEQANIADMIDAVLSLPNAFDLLIIDDNSPDLTAEEVQAKMPNYPGRLHLQQRAGKLGLGTAYIAGFKWGLAQGYDLMIEMDADFSHKPEDLPRLVAACDAGADVAIGSRYVRGGNVEDWPTDRILLSKWASRYVRMITWIPVHDTTAGFVCYKRAVLDKIDLDKIRFIGYAFQIELKYAAWRCGFTLREIPIVFKDRQKGISKMSKGIFKEAVYGVITMRWKSFFQSYTKR
jgi:dolichol-phosphate mannosyltransferase